MWEGKNARGKQWKLLKFSRSPSHNSTCSGSHFKPLSCGSILWPNKSVESNVTPTPRPSSPALSSSHGNTIHSIECNKAHITPSLLFIFWEFWSLQMIFQLPKVPKFYTLTSIISLDGQTALHYLKSEWLFFSFKFQKVVHTTAL